MCFGCESDVICSVNNYLWLIHASVVWLVCIRFCLVWISTLGFKKVLLFGLGQFSVVLISTFSLV